jgi:opacity protein-like surface antigen
MNRKFLAFVALGATLIAPGAIASAETTVPVIDPGTADPLVDQPGDWAGYAHVGYRLDPHWRLDLKGGYHANNASPASAPNFCVGPSCDPARLALGSYSVVANLVFDALPDTDWVDPFVGVGVSRFDPGTIALSNPLRMMQTAPGGSGLGYQAIVGLAFRPHDRLRFDLTYRWMDGSEPGVTGLPTALSGRFQDHAVAITVRYALSSPRAVMPPVGGLGPTRPHAALTRTVVVETPAQPEALAAEAEAAAVQTALSAGEGRPSQVVVDGHADTASEADYNGRLAERRSKAMADAMATLGVPASAIDANWTGDPAAQPQTADQARAAAAP